MKSCCGCFTLRTGGLTLTYLELIYWFILLFGRCYIIAVVELLCVTLCLYGIHCNRRSFMLAHIILRWMLTVSYAIITFVLVCFRISGGAVLNTLINDIGDAWIEYRKHQGRNIVHIEKTRNELSNTIINIISLICVISIALSALSVYFTVVMQCLYMKMGKDCRPRFVVVHHVSNPNVYQAPIVHHMPKVVHHQQNPTLAINTKC